MGKQNGSAALAFLQRERELKRHTLETDVGELHFLEPLAREGGGLAEAMGEMHKGTEGASVDMQYEAIRATWVNEDDSLVLGSDFKKVLRDRPMSDVMTLFVAAMEVVDFSGEVGAAEASDS